ncbi:MAG: hypothetical protein GX220_05190 [Treponema sp.]|nr:hypothetical protein [Treponema sp.]
MKVFLISCTQSKRTYKCKAKDMYLGSLFIKSYKYAEQEKADRIFILSAKYGLVKPDEIIEPYNQTLNKMSDKERIDWSRKVIERLSEEVSLKNDKFIILAGKNYYEKILPSICIYELPLLGLGIGIGKRLKWFDEHILKNDYLLFL